jgi:flagellar operon protein
MNDLQNRINIPITTGRPGAAPQVPNVKMPATDPATGKTFRELLEGAAARPQELTFSRHAQARVEQRNINLTQDDIQKLESAALKAAEKGIKDSLVYLNDTAFILNIPSRVVVTVVDGKEMTENVFTNIDGAVIL